MSAVDTLNNALFGNPPVPGFEPDRTGVLQAFQELFDLASALINSAVSYATVADLPVSPTPVLGLQARVFADPTATNNTYWIYQSSGWAIDTNLIASLANVVQPLVDAATAAQVAATVSANSATASAAGAAGSAGSASTSATSATASQAAAAGSAGSASTSATSATASATTAANAAAAVAAPTVFATHAAFATALSGLSNGNVQIIADETHGGDWTIYSVTSHVATFLLDLTIGTSGTRLSLFNAMKADGLFNNFQGV